MSSSEQMAPGWRASVPPARLLQHSQSLHTASKKPAQKKGEGGDWRGGVSGEGGNRRGRTGGGGGVGGAGEWREKTGKFHGTSAKRRARLDRRLRPPAKPVAHTRSREIGMREERDDPENRGPRASRTANPQ